MGRVKKYFTDGDMKRAQKEWSRKYYEKNKLTINRKRMIKYYDKKSL
jgi:hypothetical protein